MLQLFTSLTQNWRGVEEAAVALVVGLLMVVWATVVPNWDWEEFEWKELTRFVLCQVVSIGAFVLICFGGLEIPEFDPVCQPLQGSFNAIVTGFLAFLANKFVDNNASYVGDQVRNLFNKIRGKNKSDE